MAINKARTEIDGLLEDSPSLGPRTESLIKKQILVAARLAADDLKQDSETAEGGSGAAQKDRVHGGAGARRLVPGSARLIGPTSPICSVSSGSTTKI